MSAVKYPYLSLFIRLDIRCPDDIYTCFFQREFILMITLYYPKVEDLRGIHQFIFLTETFGKLMYLILGISGTDPVHQGVAEIIFSLYPVLKVLGKLPKVSVFKYAV